MQSAYSLLRRLTLIFPVALALAFVPAASAAPFAIRNLRSGSVPISKTSARKTLAVTPLPTITTLSPTSAVAGGAAFTLTINGTNFTSAATSIWGATPLKTTYVSATKLTAVVPASLIASTGKASVTVITASGASSSATFTINPPPPTITTLSSTSVVAGSQAFTLTINGANYLPGALATVVKWNSIALTTTYVSSTQLKAAVPANLIANAGTFNISVVTAGGTSAMVPFTVNMAPPAISSISPTQLPAGHADFTLDVYGTHFTSTAIVYWGTRPLVTVSAGGGILLATVPASLVATASKASITVTTAGGTSAPITFTVTPPQPIITSLSPNTAAAGSAKFTLTVNGTDFLTTSLVIFGSTQLATTYVNSTQLTASVPASLIAVAGTTGVYVYTPGGGGKSPISFFTINPAAPSITSFSPASASAGGAGFMLTINGTAFTPSATTIWGTTSLGTVYNSPTQLTIAVPASLIEFSGTASITVNTAAGTSTPVTYTIKPASPTISGLSTSVATAGGAAFTLAVYGTNFTSTSTVKWGSTALATTYLSATELTATVPAALIASVGTVNITVSTATGTSVPITFTINPAIKITTATLPSGTAGNPYSGPINVVGGVPGYVWTVKGLPDFLTFFNTNDRTLTITGTPASSGSVTFQVSVEDTIGATAGPITYTINFGARPSGANNGNLNGSYVCLYQGTFDDDEGRWASLGSFQADGKGNFTGGVFDTNSHDVGSGSGIMTGSYSVGSDNNGLASIHTVLTDGAAGIQTTQWAIALTSATQPSQQFRMIEIDDLGTLPSYQQGTANCYLTTPSTFAASTISGHSFAFGLDGENNSSNLKASAGFFSASNGKISNGTIDEALGGNATVQTTAFAGSYTTPDSTTGRFTVALKGTGTSTGFTVYIIDANRMFVLDNTSNDGEQAGNMRTLQQASYSGASINGPFVLYTRGAEFKDGGSTPSGYYADVIEGKGDGAGTMTINQSYTDDDGSYSVGSLNGGPIVLTFDSTHSGRVTFSSASGTDYLYLFNTNSAFEMSIKDNGSVDSGWLEPQTQTAFTDAMLANRYLFGELPLLSAKSNGNVGEYNLTGSSGITSAISTAGEEESSWDQLVNMTYDWDATAPGTGTFLIASSTSQAASCAVINSTKFVCTSQSDSSPSIKILQQ